MDTPTVTIQPSPFVLIMGGGATPGVPSISKILPAAPISSPTIQIGQPH